jgi:hypothetical protein
MYLKVKDCRRGLAAGLHYVVQAQKTTHSAADKFASAVVLLYSTEAMLGTLAGSRGSEMHRDRDGAIGRHGRYACPLYDAPVGSVMVQVSWASFENPIGARMST